MSGLDFALQSDLARADIIKQLYGSLLSGAGSTAGTQGLFSNLFGGQTVGELLGGLFGGLFS